MDAQGPKPVIVTTTQYPSLDEHRLGLCLKTMLLARIGGYEVVVVDDSGDKRVSRIISQTGAHVFACPETGMGRQRREVFAQALKIVSADGILLWLEPEKYDLIRFIPQIVRPLAWNEAGIVIPLRSDASWRTYPGFQVESEKRTNAVYQKATGLVGADQMFGPVALRREHAHYFTDYRPEQFGFPDRWDAIHIPPLVAYADGVTVTMVGVDFHYPPDQCQLELADPAMREKRRVQEVELSAAYQKAAKMLGLPR